MCRNLNIRHAIYPIVSLLLFWPILWWGYWPTHDWTDVPGYLVGRDFINLWAGPQFAFGGRLSTLFDLAGYPTARWSAVRFPLPHGVTRSTRSLCSGRWRSFHMSGHWRFGH
jgi:hypothetical protein